MTRQGRKERGNATFTPVGLGVVSSDEMSFSARALLDDPEALSHWLRAELLGYLRCPEDVRGAVRKRLRQDPSFMDWCDLLDELETGGAVMRQVRMCRDYSPTGGSVLGNLRDVISL